MEKKSVEDYLTDGIYGVKLPKQAERNYFLGTLRERIVIALTIGQVMKDKGLVELEKAMQEHPSAKLIFNGHVTNQFLKEEKALANKYNIPFTIITDEENKTDIGAVLAYDYAIDKEHIFIDEKDESESELKTDKTANKYPFIEKVKRWFST